MTLQWIIAMRSNPDDLRVAVIDIAMKRVPGAGVKAIERSTWYLKR
jgi:hypothetical protein